MCNYVFFVNVKDEPQSKESCKPWKLKKLCEITADTLSNIIRFSFSKILCIFE